MKIDGIKGGVRSAEKSKKTSKPRGTVNSASSSISSFGETAEVEVADHASTMNLIKELVDASPEVRVDQVERIVGQLKGKKYKVNFEKVAESFIKEAILTEIARRGRKS